MGSLEGAPKIGGDMITGVINLPKMDGEEISPGITLIGEPTAMPGTNKLRCLANVYGCLAVVELKVTLKESV